MKPRISLITLGVADLERSTKFYRDGLGLPVMGDHDGVTFFELRGTWLSLFPREELAKDAGIPAEGSGFAAFSLAHNVASKEEVDAVLQQAGDAGAKIVKPAQDAFWGGYSGYFADPDGFLWEVAWNPEMDLT
jgi:catechol 2,3-dioxygenase-like lactoylglutathione lyase family enzyme